MHLDRGGNSSMLSGANRKLVLEDGSVYEGFAFGAPGEKFVEIVFNTSMVGYQEILSDPSYTDQGVVMTYPMIGNYGMADDDYETETPTIGALIVREYNDEPSNFRSTRTLGDVMAQYGVAGLSGVDTRCLTRHIRNFGSCKGMLVDVDVPTQQVVDRLSGMEIPRDAVSRVSRRMAVHYEGVNAAYHVVAVDCGMKQNIVRSMQKKGCDVTVVPWNTDAETIASLQPDGVFLSNGPGDPTDVPELIATVRALLGRFPIFGICLGHQILSLAYGAKTYKLKFGHRGGNHPVKDLSTDKVEITSQNHSYAVDTDSLAATPLTVTHVNLLDDTVEGVACDRDKAFGVQYHPESAPGPQDSAYLFDRFIRWMKEAKDNA